MIRKLDLGRSLQNGCHMESLEHVYPIRLNVRKFFDAAVCVYWVPYHGDASLRIIRKRWPHNAAGVMRGFLMFDSPRESSGLKRCSMIPCVEAPRNMGCRRGLVESGIPSKRLDKYTRTRLGDR